MLHSAIKSHNLLDTLAQQQRCPPARFEVDGKNLETANRAEQEAVALVTPGNPVKIIDHATGNNRICFIEGGRVYTCWAWNYKN
jgi:hypothetical protein